PEGAQVDAAAIGLGLIGVLVGRIALVGGGLGGLEPQILGGPGEHHGVGAIGGAALGLLVVGLVAEDIVIPRGHQRGLGRVDADVIGGDDGVADRRVARGAHSAPVAGD